MVLAFHIGTDPLDLVAGDVIEIAYRGPGGAVLNHTNSGISGLHAAMKMVASGALDRHQELKALISEGGATWVPYIGDRMDEAYRQHYFGALAQAVDLPQRDPVPAGLCVVPARRLGGRGDDGHGVRQRHVAATTPISREPSVTRRRPSTSSSRNAPMVMR